MRAGEWVGENRDRGISIVCKETGAARDFAEATYGSNLKAAMTPSLDRERLGLLDIQIDRLARHGFIDSKVNIDDWIAPEILKAGAAASKEDVSLLQ
ncbi:ABC-type nitrate/sulfonate/bicarbonate transport system substrate-binding protein [Shinella sp. BE166]|uniref:hypothetical protein n=1 Tax=Shinella sp. BE166 TaxID=3373918 RepID=UPI003EB9108B